MKKILCFIVFVFIIVSIVYLQYKQRNKSNDFNKEERYTQKLYCIPENTIDKGIVYAEAMKDYWEWEVDKIWYRYEQHKKGEHPTGKYDGSLSAKRIKEKCGLEKSFLGKRKFNKDVCLPFVFYKNGTIKAYNPYNIEKNDYLYKPENYNKNVDFFVNMSGLSYKEDCCKLLTYEEMKIEINNIKEIEKNNSKFIINDEHIKNIDDINLLKKIYFLRILRNGEYKVIIYYPVSQCGEVIDFAYLYR
ncbi:MAG: hypothetical protein IJ143_00375 [Neisseriaceae bacterium]|nr:hypothetical protein [Neisseriaceae bacterium]